MTLTDVHAAIARVRDFAAAGDYSQCREIELSLFVGLAVFARGGPEPAYLAEIAREALKVRVISFPRNYEDPEANPSE